MPRAKTEDFSDQATIAHSGNTTNDVDGYKYDIQVWTSLQTMMRLPAVLDTGCDPNMIREDIVHEAGLQIDGYTGPPLSQADGTCYMPPGQVTTRIQFCGGTRTFNVNLLLAPPDADYDVLVGGKLISSARLLIRNPAGFFLTFTRETSGKFATNMDVIAANVIYAEQTVERQRRQQEAQSRNAEIERQRAEYRHRQRERELAEQQHRQRGGDRGPGMSSSRHG